MTRVRRRGEDSNISSGGADLTITKPAGTVDNDIMVAAVVCRGQTVAPPAGWTQLYLDGASDFGIWWKRAATEGASYVFVTSGGTNPRACTGSIVSYKDCPTNVSPTIGTMTKQTSVSVKGLAITPTTGAAIALHIGACSSATSDTITSTPPAGMRERKDTEDRDTSGTSVQCQVAISEGYIVPYISTGDRTATLSASKANWGVLVILYQLPLSPGPSTGDGIEALVELTHWDEAGAAEVIKKYSSRGVIFTDNVFYEARILGRFEIAQEATDLIGAGGRIATTVSEIDLDNKDYALDTIHERMLAIGRTVTIKTIISALGARHKSDLGSGASSTAVTVFTGVTSALTPMGTHMRLSVTDLSGRLNVPVQQNKYDGTAGLGGDEELKGVAKPITFGRVYNIQPQGLGTVNLGDGELYTYQSNGNGIQATRIVRERGIEMVEVTGVAPGIGEWRDWPSSGVFQIGFTPNGIITCDVSGDNTGTYPNQTGEVVERLLLSYGPQFAAGDLDATEFDDIDLHLPGEIGFHIPAGAVVTANEAVERVLRSGAVWMSGSRSKKFRLALASPAPAERLALKQPDILSLRPIPLPSVLQPAPRHVDIRAEINWFPMTDVSSGLRASKRRKLESPGKVQRSTSTLIQTRQLPERTWSLPGLWRLTTSAQERADQLRLWVEPGLRAFEVTTDRYRNTVEVGMGCEIESYPLYDLSAGFAGIVSGWREVPATGRVTLKLIG